MNKETFLQELQGYLRILEDQEQQDILDEYAQHIDMKMQKGLSEEEAIQDFGTVQQLAAEILEAYHVKPEFEQKKPRIKLPDLNKAASESKRSGTFVTEWIRKKASGFGNGIKKGFCRIGEKIKGFWKWKCGLFHRKPKTLWNGFIVLCIWCLRLLWNVFWACASVLAGIFTMTALFCFGALLILRFQGYPLTGIVLILFGLLLCCGTISFWCFSLIFRKKKAETEETLEKSLEEVPYEQTV